MIDFSLLFTICFTILIIVVLKILKFQNDTRTTIGFSPPPPNKIVIVNTPEECVDVLQILNSKCIKYNVLGFDCEWVTNSCRNPIALLQLSSFDGFCVLIRLNKFASYIPMELKALLENPLILKVGVVPSNDANYLMQDYNILVRGCLDLRFIIEIIGGNPQGGLSGLTERILNIKMDKSWAIRCGDWEADELTEKQILYAANDALFAVDIFRISASGFQTYFKYTIVQCFKYILKCFLLYSLSDECFPTVPSFVYEYSDMNYHKKSHKSTKVVSNYDDIQKNFVKQKPVKALKPASRAFCSRQSPLYHNCFMQAPDGAMLCTCDRKKAIWYVSKGLADLITEDPLTVRLKFEPSGRAVGSVGEYYIQTKSNCCVVCGKVDNCIRKNVVPHEYRKNFPKIMKDHVSHDILLLCLPCHLLSNSFDLQMKHRLADMCKAPFCQGGNTKYMENRELSSVRAAAKALLRKTHNIPPHRQVILQGIVKKHYGVEELTNEILRDASAIKTNILNEDYDPHGVKVVQYFSIEENGGILRLEKMWREHFLITMRPRFMPKLWSVTHTEDRLAIRVAENRILPDELVVAGMKDCVPLLEEARKTRLIY